MTKMTAQDYEAATRKYIAERDARYDAKYLCRPELNGGTNSASARNDRINAEDAAIANGWLSEKRN
jgi:hypothetical protein